MKNLSKICIIGFVTLLLFAKCQKSEIQKTAVLNPNPYAKQEAVFKERVMGFEKIRIEERKTLVNSIRFREGIPVGIDGNYNILKKLPPKIQLSFFETLFDNNRGVILDGESGKVIARSFVIEQEMKNSGSSDENKLSCWTSLIDQKNVGTITDRNPCDYAKDHVCLYYDLKKCPL